MFDIFGIGNIINTVKSSQELLSKISGRKEAKIKQAEIDNLRQAFASVYESLLNSQSEHFKIQNEIEAVKTKNRTLEEEIRQFKDWEAEKQNYIPHTETPYNLPITYFVKKDIEETEAHIKLCANCFYNKKKFVLYINKVSAGKYSIQCPNCPTKQEFYS